jgi:hypothetical protein
MTEKQSKRLGGKRLERIKEILSIWSGQTQREMSYTEIVSEAKKKGIAARQVARDLKTLSSADEEGKTPLRKIKAKGKKAVFYKPNVKIWFLCFVKKEYVDLREEKQIQPLKNVIFNKFNRNLRWHADREETYHCFIVPAEGKGMKPESLRVLNSMTKKLITELKESLSLEYFDGKTVAPEEVHKVLMQNVTNLVSNYMDLWSYISKPDGLSNKHHMFKVQMKSAEKAIQGS